MHQCAHDEIDPRTRHSLPDDASRFIPKDSWGRLETIALVATRECDPCSALNVFEASVVYHAEEEQEKQREEEGVDSFIVGRVNEKWHFGQR